MVNPNSEFFMKIVKRKTPLSFLRRNGWSSVLCTMLWVLGSVSAGAQSPTLEACLAATETHLPLARQQPLIEAAHQAAMTSLQRNYWPQATLNAQATWQTEVTSLGIKIPIPGFEVPTLSKDQYRATLELGQTIWDGGLNNGLKAVQDAQTRTDLQRLNVDKYAAREQTVQLYCGALLAQTHLQTLAAANKDVRARQQRLRDQLANGTAIPAQIQTFEARLLEIEQQEDEAQARKLSALDGLALLTGLTFNAQDSLMAPRLADKTATDNNRPELTLFGLQQQLTQTQERLAHARSLPRLNAFATLGYGRPGLNFLSNDFSPYAIVGVQFRWNLNALYTGTAAREQEQWRLQSARLAAQKDQFLLQTNVRLQQQQREVERLRNLLEKDRRILTLRENIAATAAVQLENGVLTPSEYLTETTNVITARLNAQLHEVQRLQALLLAQFYGGNL